MLKIVSLHHLVMVSGSKKKERESLFGPGAWVTVNTLQTAANKFSNN